MSEELIDKEFQTFWVGLLVGWLDGWVGWVGVWLVLFLFFQTMELSGVCHQAKFSKTLVDKHRYTSYFVFDK